MDAQFEVFCPSPLWVDTLLASIVWVFPVGALVMRRHFVEATGARYAAKVTLNTLAALSAPAAFFSGLVVIAGIVESLGILWTLLQHLLQ